MSKKKQIIKLPSNKIDYAKLPNLWHQEQVMKGGKIHKSEKYTIPRKKE